MESSSGIVLSGGSSNRFGTEKALVDLEGKPLIQYVLDAIMPLVDETIVVVKTVEQGERIREACKGSFALAFDESDVSSPLAGILAGVKRARGEVSLLLACDAPLLSSEVLSYLLHIARAYDAVIPRWPNGNMEPLQATYNTAKTRKATTDAIEAGELRIFHVIRRLDNIFYLSTETLRRFDPDLRSFENVNTPEDLSRVSVLLRS